MTYLPRWLRSKRQPYQFRVLRLQPGDVLVARMDESITMETAAFIKAQFERYVPGNEVIVTNLDLAVIRQGTEQPADVDWVKVGCP